ncbi:MAG TPA: hypothetical protein VD833_17020 [Vicinamibacterales bacterium]|nr:hypothetical protein [Vicinamibacterales bacterium]
MSSIGCSEIRSRPSSPARIGLILCCGIAALGGGNTRSAAQIGMKVTQITQGPRHHYFGYIGQSRTIPWNASGRYLLALQVGFQDRLPNAGDAAEICLIDAHDNYAMRVVDSTRAWNPQQGTMFYWNPEHPETQFFFNDRDRATGKVFTVLFDIAADNGKGRRVREYRFDDTPVANGGVAQNGGYFMAINYARMARLRPVTGYPEAWDWTTTAGAPADDGIFRIDLGSGTKTLIVSFATLKEALRGTVENLDARHFFINHTLNNRNNDLLYFFCRADFEQQVHGPRVNAVFTVRPDGSDLTRHETFIGGHPEWAWGPTIIGSSEGRQVVYHTARKQIVDSLGGRDVFPNPEGDVSLSPDGSWFVNGHRDGEYHHYTFLEMRTRRVVKSPPVFLSTWNRGPLRLDPAPAWNRTSDAIVVPGIASDGTRQMFLLELAH